MKDRITFFEHEIETSRDYIEVMKDREKNLEDIIKE